MKRDGLHMVTAKHLTQQAAWHRASSAASLPETRVLVQFGRSAMQRCPTSARNSIDRSATDPTDALIGTHA